MKNRQMVMSVAVLTTMVALVFIGGPPGTVYGDDDPVVSTREDPTADGGHEFLYVYASGKEVVVVMSADGILVSIGKIDSSGRVVSVEKYFYDEQGQLKETDTYDGYFPNGNVINKIVKIFDNRGCEKSEEQSFYNEEGVRGETATLYFSQGTGNDCGTADLNTIVLYDDQGHVVSSTTWDWPRVVLRHSETSDRNLQAAGVTPQGRPKLPGVPNEPNAEGNTALARHPGQSIEGLKRAQGAAGPTGTGGTMGVAGPGTGTATGGTAGVADTSRGEPQREPTPSNQKKKWIKRKVTNVGSSPSGGNSAVGGTAGGSSGQSDAGNERKIIWQKPSSAATNTGSSSPGGNSATGGTAGVAAAGTTTGSSGSATVRRKSQSKKSLNAPSQSVHPTPTPTPRKKKPGTEVQNEY